MGCDIHLYTEYKKDDVWFPADCWVEDDHWGEGQKTWRVPYHLRPYDDRNYNFFAFLADVRNQTWGEKIPVISRPKGVPADVSERIKKEIEQWDADGHSHSWLTIGELEEGWKRLRDEKIKFHACPTLPDDRLKAWLEIPEEQRPSPEAFCAGGWSGRAALQAYTWYEPLSKLIDHAYDKLHEYLWDVGFEYKVEDRENNIRCVFFFDN